MFFIKLFQKIIILNLSKFIELKKLIELKKYLIIALEKGKSNPNVYNLFNINRRKVDYHSTNIGVIMIQ